MQQTYADLAKKPDRKMFGDAIINTWRDQWGDPTVTQNGASKDMKHFEVQAAARAWLRISEEPNIKALAEKSPWTSSDFAALASEAAAQIVIKLWPGMIKDLGWTRQLSVTDFKSYPITVFIPPPLVQIKEGETYPPSTPAIVVNARTALTTWGNLFNLSEHAYMNDRNGIFLSIGQQLAFSAAEKLADICFAIFAENPMMDDGQPWLNPAAGNCPDETAWGNGTRAFDAASLGVAINGLRQQTANGLKISLAPRYLLIDPLYEMQARLLTAQYFEKDELTIISDARMTGLGFALIADPEKFPAIGRVTLGASGLPSVEVLSGSGSKVAGLALRVHADFGVTPMSRAGVYWVPSV